MHFDVRSFRFVLEGVKGPRRFLDFVPSFILIRMS